MAVKKILAKKKVVKKIVKPVSTKSGKTIKKTQRL